MAAPSALAQTAGAAPTDPALIEKIRKSNAECLGCHTEAALKAPPRDGMDLLKLKTLLVDPAAFERSNHAGMECKTCHGQTANEYPHREGLTAQVSPCGECHAQKSMRIEAQYDASIHAKRLKGKFTCQSCHDPHLYKVAAKLGEPSEIVRQDNAMCFDCHESDLKFATFGDALTPPKRRPDLDDIHEWLPNAKLHWGAVRCVECHTPVSPIKSLALSHEIVGKDKAEKNCVACHTRDTELKTRLYRHLVTEEREKLGFANSIILGDSYVIGATRNAYFDQFAVWSVLLTVAGVMGHGALRVFTAGIRRLLRKS
ncbi:MAG: cytochrome c3 family protein [Alphaproteobacteria bacterium]|nr:cytochrome c3 family protein [Alphaproteobacteria bacterium]